MARTRSRSGSAHTPHPNKKPRLAGDRTEPRLFDIQAYPHILDAVIDAAEPEALHALRVTSREMLREVDGRDRHLTLQQMPENLWAKRDESHVWDIMEEEREKRIPDPVWAVTPTGVRYAFLPDNADVLDIDGWVSRLWFDWVEPNIGLWDKDGEELYGYDTDDKMDDESDSEYQFGLRRMPLTDQDRKIRRWLRRNEELFYDRFNPRLVRYPDGFDDQRKAYGPLKPDPCAVYFCDFSDLILGLHHLDEHYSEWAGMRGAFLDTVFNVQLVKGTCGEELWNTINPASIFDLHLKSNAYTVLFHSTPEFLESIEDHYEEPKFFVGLLKCMIRNFIALEKDGVAEGKATIVGYDTWPLVALADPRERDGRGAPADAAECVRRWIAIHVADVKEELQKEEAQKEGKTLSRPEAELDDPIRLLTLEEWREEIGEEYFKLMTDKDYQYESKKPLPPFKRHPSVEPLSLLGKQNAGDRWVWADGRRMLESQIDPTSVREIEPCRG